MKTAKEILKENMGKSKYFNVYEQIAVIEAMEQYANQKWNEAIELAAQEAKVRVEGITESTDGMEWANHAIKGGLVFPDKNSILKLKK